MALNCRWAERFNEGLTQLPSFARPIRIMLIQAAEKVESHRHSCLCAFVQCSKTHTAKSGCATKTGSELTFSATTYRLLH